VVLVALYLGRSRAPDVIPGRTEPPAPSTPPPGQPGSTSPNAVTPVTDAFRTRRSNVEVRTAGRVVRLLPDDRQGSLHERILVRVEGGPTVLVAHNLDLAPRVPVAVGDSIELKGEYEWNPKGGVVHWTHRDPEGRHETGWIWSRGRLYQ